MPIEIDLAYLPNRLRDSRLPTGKESVAVVNGDVLLAYRNPENGFDCLYYPVGQTYRRVSATKATVDEWINDIAERNMAPHDYFTGVLLGDYFISFASTARSPTEALGAYSNKYVGNPREFCKSIIVDIIRESKGPCFVQHGATYYYRLSSDEYGDECDDDGCCVCDSRTMMTMMHHFRGISRTCGAASNRRLIGNNKIAK